MIEYGERKQDATQRIRILIGENNSDLAHDAATAAGC